MKRAALVLIVGAALSCVMTAPASAASADPHASCAGLAGASRAGYPTAEAQDSFGVIGEAFSEGRAPGSTFSDFASHHQGTAEACLG